MVYGFPEETLRKAFRYLKFVSEMTIYDAEFIEAQAIRECGYIRAKQMIVTWSIYGHLITNK